MSRPTIRHLESADYAPLIAVVDDWWGGRAMRAMLPKLFFLHFRPTSFAAELDGRFVGFLCGFVSQTHPAVAYVHFIGVDPVARGSAIGRQLYERFFAAAAAAGCKEAVALTGSANAASIAFHQRLGFEVLPSDEDDATSTVWTDYDGPGEDRVRFRCWLDDSRRGAASNRRD